MSAAITDAKAWLIKRNCSASPRQLAFVFGSLVAVSFAFGIGFAAFGLWMVLPFVGVELIAVGTAFFCYGRHAADFERIAIDAHKVSVERIEGARRTQWSFEPRLSHVQMDSRGHRWGRRVRVYLMAPEIKLEVGRHLLDARRWQLGRELESTLMRARAAVN